MAYKVKLDSDYVVYDKSGNRRATFTSGKDRDLFLKIAKEEGLEYNIKQRFIASVLFEVSYERIEDVLSQEEVGQRDKLPEIKKYIEERLSSLKDNFDAVLIKSVEETTEEITGEIVNKSREVNLGGRPPKKSYNKFQV